MYGRKNRCPLLESAFRRQRKEHMLKLARDYNVQGAILVQQKFCHPHETDAPLIESWLREKGIPSLLLA